MKTYFCIIFSLILHVHSQQFHADRNSTVTPTQHLIRATSSRQYGPPPITISEQIFKPNGYQYPTNQKLTFSHDNKLHIYLFQNKLSVYCATDTTYEKITWKKYMCPNQISAQNGETIAIGPMVQNPNLYGINSFGRNEEYVSELLIKQPLTPQTDGVYVCEGVFISDKYPYEPVSTVRDLIVVGGKNLYQNCFSSSSLRTSVKRSTTNDTSSD